MIHFVLQLLMLWISAYWLGQFARRCGQSELLGQMLAGLILGPAVLGLTTHNNSLSICADVALLFVVISAGLEIRLHHISSALRGRGPLLLLPSIILPAISGGAIALWFEFSLTQATVVALCLSITALPVALRILTNFELNGTRIAHLTIAGALLADVSAFLILGTVINHTQTQSSSLAAMLGLDIAKIAGLLAGVAVTSWLCHRIDRNSRLSTSALPTIWLLALMLIVAMATTGHLLGFHPAIGAFLGAIAVCEHLGEHPLIVNRLRQPMGKASETVFAPLFIAYQGTHFVLPQLIQPGLAICLVLAALISKLLGGYWSARLHGLSTHDAKGVAIIMNARGVMEMVLANLAYRAGLVDESLFSILLLAGIVTTLLTPVLLKYWQSNLTTASTPQPVKNSAE